jgi:hypothetical protein
MRYAREFFAVLRTSLASDVHLFAGVNLLLQNYSFFGHHFVQSKNISVKSLYRAFTLYDEPCLRMFVEFCISFM